MLAAWLVGVETQDERDCGEICILEIDAAAIASTTIARAGVKAHGDERLTTDMSEVEVPVDATRPHTWTVIWHDTLTTIGGEGRIVRRIAQARHYPLVLMIDLFEIGNPSGPYPKSATVHAVRGWNHD